MINDGTKDKSAEIAKEYARNDYRIKVYDFQNCGVSVARNRGLFYSRGEYIVFVDGDDWVATNMLSDLIHYANSTDVDMIKYGVEEINFARNKHNLIKFNNKRIYCNNILKKYFEGVLWTMPCNALYKRELALSVRFPEGLTYEDNYTAGMYLALAKKVLVVPDIYYFYRVNPQGASKGGVKYPLDKCLVIYRLITDLKGLYIDPEMFCWKFAVEVYHFIRGWNNLYRVCAVEKNFLYYVMSRLDIRRKMSLLYIVFKKRILIK